MLYVTCCTGVHVVLYVTCCTGVHVVLYVTCCTGVHVVLYVTCCTGVHVVLYVTCCTGVHAVLYILLLLQYTEEMLEDIKRSSGPVLNGASCKGWPLAAEFGELMKELKTAKEMLVEKEEEVKELKSERNNTRVSQRAVCVCVS